jgi:hypothetical protein
MLHKAGALDGEARKQTIEQAHDISRLIGTAISRGPLS